MRLAIYCIAIVYLVLQVGLSSSCTHDPILDNDITPVDTTGNDPGDTTSVDPNDTSTVTEPCDPDIVYFDLQVLPILRSNCAFSGCHDAATAEDGVILESYESVMETADVEIFDLDNSEIYEVLTDPDEEERMPPAPTERLAQDQIQLIAKWILQGAQDLDCDPDAAGCDTDNVSFAEDIFPVLQNTCVGCHSGPAPNGGINLSDHAGVKVVATNGKLLGALSWEAGFSPMPQGGDQMSDCFISQVESWINAGAPNN